MVVHDVTSAVLQLIYELHSLVATTVVSVSKYSLPAGGDFGDRGISLIDSPETGSGLTLLWKLVDPY